MNLFILLSRICSSRRILAVLIPLFSISLGLQAQGYITGGFETGTNYYVQDSKTAATVPDGHFGSNNYLKLDYYNSKFTAGLQMEAYGPALVGYSSELKGVNLTNYYVNWKDESFSSFQIMGRPCDRTE